MKRILALSIVFCFLLAMPWTFTACAKPTVEYEEAETYAAGALISEEKITAIKIFWACGEVTVKGDATTYRVTVWEDYPDRDENTVRHRIKDGVLEIMPCASGANVDELAKGITVGIPLDLAQQLEYVSVSVIGDTKVNVSALQAKNLDLTAEAGDVTLDRVFGEAVVTTTSGNLKMENHNIEKLSFTSETGNAEVTAFFAGFTAVMQEGLGSFTSEYEVYQNENIYTYGTQENSLVFRTKGSVSVKRLSVTS